MGMLRNSGRVSLFMSVLALGGCAETGYNLLDNIYGGRPGPGPGPQQAQNTKPVAAYEPATRAVEEEIIPTPLPRVLGVPNPVAKTQAGPVPQPSVSVQSPQTSQPVVVSSAAPASVEQGWRIVQPTATQGVYETGDILQQDTVARARQAAAITQPAQVQVLPQPPLPGSNAGRVIYGSPGTTHDLARIEEQQSVSLSGEAEKEALLQGRAANNPELPDYGSLLDGLKLDEPPATNARARLPQPRSVQSVPQPSGTSEVALAAPPTTPVAAPKATTSSFVLPGTSWIVDTVGGVPVVEAMDMHFDRSSNTVGGKAPCNNYGAEFTPGENGSLAISALFATQNGCRAIAVEQEFFAALESVASYEVTAAADTMVLFDASGAPVIGLKAY